MTHEEESLHEHPLDVCPICGGHQFSWGHLQGSGLNVVHDDTPVVTKLLTMGLRVRARICKSCQNVQLFAG